MAEIQLALVKTVSGTSFNYTPQGGVDDGTGNGTAAARVVLTGATGLPLLPQGATRVVASSGNVANATATATLPAVSGKTNYVTGFSISAGGATLGSTVTATLSGLAGGSLSYTFTAPALGGNALPLFEEFVVPIPASASNTAISLTLPALGAGNINATVNIHGYVV